MQSLGCRLWLRGHAASRSQLADLNISMQQRARYSTGRARSSCWRASLQAPQPECRQTRQLEQ
eukprot:8536717-Alexandrium_andersonii.AAC.1